MPQSVNYDTVQAFVEHHAQLARGQDFHDGKELQEDAAYERQVRDRLNNMSNLEFLEEFAMFLNFLNNGEV